MGIDSAINAAQKSNQCGGAIAPTDTRPCRGGKNQEQGGSSATADFSKETSFCLDKETKETSFCLDKEKRGSLPDCAKRPNGLQAKRSKNAALYSFRGWGERGEGKPLFLLRKQVMMRI